MKINKRRKKTKRSEKIVKTGNVSGEFVHKENKSAVSAVKNNDYWIITHKDGFTTKVTDYKFGKRYKKRAV